MPQVSHLGFLATLLTEPGRLHKSVHQRPPFPHSLRRQWRRGQGSRLALRVDMAQQSCIPRSKIIADLGLLACRAL
jgi:hypothetical protein